jgi:hypothetical protein
MFSNKPMPLVYVHADALAHEEESHAACQIQEPVAEDAATTPETFEKLEAELWQPHTQDDHNDVNAVVGDVDEVLYPVEGIELDA